MAVKKSSKTGEATAGKKKAGPKKQGASAASVASETGAKSATPKGTKKSAGPKAEGGAKKSAGEVKLNDRQREFLKKIKDAGEPGYLVGQKIEQRTIDALLQRKLLKKGPKNKEKGGYHYVLTKAGEKHLGAAPAAPAQQ